MSYDPQMEYHKYTAKFTEAEEKLYQSADMLEKSVIVHHEFRTRGLTEPNSKASIAAEQALVFASRAHFFAFENLRVTRKILSNVRVMLCAVIAITLIQIWNVL